MLLVRRFQGLRGLFVECSQFWGSGSQELYLNRLAMSDHSSLSTSGCGLEHNLRTIGIVVKGNSGWRIMQLYLNIAVTVTSIINPELPSSTTLAYHQH